MKILKLLLFITPAILTAPRASNAQAVKNYHTGREINLAAPLEESEMTKVLVLATPHLSSLGDRLERSALDSLLQILEAFDPGIICVERMPGFVVERMQLHREQYSFVFE